MRSDHPPIHRTAVFSAALCVAMLMALGAAQTREAHRPPPCDVDCVSRDAGYAWGKELGISDPDECGGNSKDFVAGCQAYATKHEDPMALPADDVQSDQAADDEQDKLDDVRVDDKVDVLTGPSADPDDNVPLPSEAPTGD